MQSPPYPATTRAGGFRFELDCERIAQSDTWALAGAHQRPLLLMLWFIAWQQTPCGSLPGDDTLIAARLGLPPDEFQQVKPILLRRWSQASDGRLYHPVLTELVLDMIGRKTRETQRKAAYRQKQREARGGGLSHGTHAGQSGDGHGNATGVAQDSGGSDDTTTTTTTTTTDMSLSLERDSADTHASSNGKSKATLGVRELMADGVERQHAEDWMKARRAKRLPLTQTALDIVKTEAEKAGITLAEAIGHAAGEGWAGFKAEWLASDGGRTRTPAAAPSAHGGFDQRNYGTGGRL